MSKDTGIATERSPLLGKQQPTDEDVEDTIPANGEQAEDGGPKKYEGMPDVQLKYIFPALAIGVCTPP